MASTATPPTVPGPDSSKLVTIQQEKTVPASLADFPSAAAAYSASAPAPLKKQRLLKLSLAHKKMDDASEESLHEHLTKYHAPKAAHVHARHGVEMYAFFFTPKPMRDYLSAAAAKLQNTWKVDQHDMFAEFYFRDINQLIAVATDPEFDAIQSEERPFVSREDIVASLGWVETYIIDGKVVGVHNGESLFGSFEEQVEVEKKAAEGA